jgi:thiol:disulfide interchange protein
MNEHSTVVLVVLFSLYVLPRLIRWMNKVKLKVLLIISAIALTALITTGFHPSWPEGLRNVLIEFIGILITLISLRPESK